MRTVPNSLKSHRNVGVVDLNGLNTIQKLYSDDRKIPRFGNIATGFLFLGIHIWILNSSKMASIRAWQIYVCLTSLLLYQRQTSWSYSNESNLLVELKSFICQLELNWSNKCKYLPALLYLSSLDQEMNGVVPTLKAGFSYLQLFMSFIRLILIYI